MPGTTGEGQVIALQMTRAAQSVAGLWGGEHPVSVTWGGLVELSGPLSGVGLSLWVWQMCLHFPLVSVCSLPWPCEALWVCASPSGHHAQCPCVTVDLRMSAHKHVV